MIIWWNKQKTYTRVYFIYYIIASILSIVFVGRIVSTSIYLFHTITLLLIILVNSNYIKVILMPFIYFVSVFSLIFATLFCYMDGQGSSMEPTIPDGSKTFIFQQNFYLKRDMIVQFEKRYPYPNELEDKNLKLVKRIVGIPEDSVYFVNNNTVLINENFYMLHEDGIQHLNSQLINGKIPIDYYFLVGDNLPSLDSKYFGLVHKDEIGGIVLFYF